VTTPLLALLSLWDHLQFPYKPSPEALIHICDTWGIPPASVIMVGDSAKDDIVCGNRAGGVTVLLDSEGRYSTPEGAALLEVGCLWCRTQGGVMSYRQLEAMC
jgi:histidinol phosphatase-like enzyme